MSAAKKTAKPAAKQPAKKEEKKGELEAFDPLVNSIKKWIGPAESAKVYDSATRDVALGALSELVAIEKLVEAVRVEKVSPHNEFVKRVNARAKEILAPLLKAKGIVTARLLEHKDRVEQANRAEAARLAQEKADAEAARDAKLRAAHALAGDAGTLLQETGQIHDEHDTLAGGFRMQERALKDEEQVKGAGKRWDFEYTDADQVPRSYCAPVDSLIRAAIQAGTREIPGVRIFQKSTLNVKSSPTVAGKPVAQLGTSQRRV